MAHKETLHNMIAMLKVKTVTDMVITTMIITTVTNITTTVTHTEIIRAGVTSVATEVVSVEGHTEAEVNTEVEVSTEAVVLTMVVVVDVVLVVHRVAMEDATPVDPRNISSVTALGTMRIKDSPEVTTNIFRQAA